VVAVGSPTVQAGVAQFVSTAPVLKKTRDDDGVSVVQVIVVLVSVFGVAPTELGSITGGFGGGPPAFRSEYITRKLPLPSFCPQTRWTAPVVELPYSAWPAMPAPLQLTQNC